MNDTALAVVQPEPFNKRQLDIITNQIAKGASEDELAFFLEVCRMTGLNPLQRQIYAVMRNSKEKDEDGNWRTVKHMTIQTGIDGYRLIASRTGQLAGIDDPTYDVESADNPNRASVTVWRFVNGQRVPFTATARWKEYVQEKDEYENNRKTGRKEPSGMWGKMPYLMLGKCAEALALRKAFPAELSGVYTGEEMQQADNDAPFVDAAPTPIRQPALHVTEQSAPSTKQWTKAEVSALFGRWQHLQPEGDSFRMADRFGAAMRDFCGHAAPFTNAERDKFEQHIARLEERKSQPRTLGAEVAEDEGDETLTPDSEMPHDLSQLPVTSIGA